MFSREMFRRFSKPSFEAVRRAPQRVNCCYRFPIRSFSQSCSVIENSQQKVGSPGVSIAERVFDELTIDKYKELIKTPEDEKLVTNILKLYEYEKYVTGAVPSTITTDEMLSFMKTGYRKRLKLFRYLYRKEGFSRQQQIKEEMRKEAIREKRAKYSEEFRSGLHFDEETNCVEYGLWKCSMFTRFSPSNVARSLDAKLLASKFFGQHLIVDFDFENGMNERELKKTIFDLRAMYVRNKCAKYPFDLWFCNLKRESKSFEWLSRDLRNLQSRSFITTSEQSYLERFPKSKLVYLSADAEKPLNQYDHEAIYIVGAHYDIGQKKKVTLSKGKKERLRMASLPLDNYVALRKSRDLSLIELILVLNTVKETGDWRQAFTHLHPSRLRNEEEIEEVIRRRSERYEFKRKNFH